MIRHLDTKPEVMARIEKGLRKQKQSERMDTLHDIVRSYVAAHQPVTRELQAVLPISHGELPDDLRGVLYRNGPGRFGNHGQTYGHLMDGDGMVVRFAIGGLGSDGRPCIRYRNSYVRTTEFVYEQRAGRLLYRNFGTQRSGGFFGNLFRTHLKNVANTNVIYHHGRLFALWEGGLPHLLDPVTLDTLERYDFFGALKNRGPLLERVLLPELPFSAHPKEDPQTGDLYNFGVYFGPHPKVLLYAVRQGVALTVTREIPLPAPLLSHDFLLTPHWQILFLFPVSLRILPTLMGQPPSYGMREIEGGMTRILLIPRDGGTIREYRAAPCFVLHFVNAYEDERGMVVVDGCRQEHFPEAPRPKEVLAGNITDLPHVKLVRYILNPHAEEGSVAEERLLGGYSSELPRIHPRHQGFPYRYVYSVSAMRDAPHGLFSAISRFDVETGTTVLRDFSPCIPGEPVMVPRATPFAEDDGYLLTVVYQGREHRSALYVLSARDLSTVCVADLPHHLPPGFHGNFVPSSACPPGWLF
ncbi:MAG TPA: carotenoid oxygenase family protein [Pseudomonadota bacterium]|nr:carotenoid oxygenase family protein [Pseudomonadota bacterium]